MSPAFGRTTKTIQPKSTALATVVTVAIVLAVAGFAYYWQPGIFHATWSLVRMVWLPALILVVALGVAALGVGISDEKNTQRVALFSLGALGVVSAGVTTFAVIYQSNAAYSTSLTTATTENTNEMVSFSDRAPFDVAAETSNRTLGDTTGTATGYVKSLPLNGDHGEYSTSVIRRGFAQGYESTQMLNVPIYGTANNSHVKFCDYSDDATLRFGGFFPKNNLTRAIYHKTSWSVSATQRDSFVVCEGDTPMVYAPLTQQKGVFAPHRVPAGVAIYNGTTGELVIEDNYEGTLPVYPQTLATQQRESTRFSQTFFDYIFKRAGYEDTSKDTDDPNGDNRAEFNMASESRDASMFVTPLTKPGSSSSIVALGTVESNSMTKGELNPYTVNTYPDGQSQQATSSIAARIMSEQLSGYKGQGLSVFEVVPQKDGTWVATIGKSQSILYRALIAPDGSITLIDGDEKVPSPGDNAENKNENSVTTKPVDEMSEDELRELGNKIVDELSKRASADTE